MPLWIEGPGGGVVGLGASTIVLDWVKNPETISHLAELMDAKLFVDLMTVSLTAAALFVVVVEQKRA
jgi:hypothetical protein